MTIGAKIKTKRKELGLSVDELAEQIGKNRATVYRYENGDIENLPLDVLEPIATALCTTPAHLMGWENNEIIANILTRLQSDEDFLNVVQTLNRLENKKWERVVEMLTIFLKD